MTLGPDVDVLLGVGDHDRLAGRAAGGVQAHDLLHRAGEQAEGIGVAQVGLDRERQLGDVRQRSDRVRRQAALVHALAEERHVLVGAGHHRRSRRSWTPAAAPGQKSGALTGWKPPGGSFQGSPHACLLGDVAESGRSALTVDCHLRDCALPRDRFSGVHEARRVRSCRTVSSRSACGGARRFALDAPVQESDRPSYDPARRSAAAVRPRSKAFSLTSCRRSGRPARMAASQCLLGDLEILAEGAQQGHVEAPLVRKVRVGDEVRASRSTPPARSDGRVDLHLGSAPAPPGSPPRPAGPSGYRPSRAEAHVAGHRAAALAHAVQLGLLDVVAGAEGGVGEDVGGLDDALAAEPGEDDVGDAGGRLGRSSVAPPAGRRQPGRARSARSSAARCSHPRMSARPGCTAGGRLMTESSDAAKRSTQQTLEPLGVCVWVDDRHAADADRRGEPLDRELAGGSWSSVRPGARVLLLAGHGGGAVVQDDHHMAGGRRVVDHLGQAGDPRVDEGGVADDADHAPRLSCGRTWRRPRPTPMLAPMQTQVSMAWKGGRTPSV